VHDHGANRATFQRLYEETAVSLRAYLRLSCRDNALADDLLQETYLRLLRRGWPELDAQRLKSYLYKTAHSALVDHYRARRREARWRAEQATIGDAHGCRPHDVVGLEGDSVDGLLELPDDMRRVFVTLTTRQQSLLWLAYVEGFKHDEIAGVIGVSASSVRVLLSRARTELAARLSSEGLAPIAARGAKG
jgi:RNA polymerase sigma-70 factor (ECF subfamily)